MMMGFKELAEKHGIKVRGVLHLGANLVQERDLYNEITDGEVIWVEAIPSVFEEAKEILKDYPKQTIIKACLSNVDDQEVTFNISNNEAQSSSFLELGHHAIIHPEVSYIDKVTLKTTRFDSLMLLLERNISKLDFLNVDLQGSEALAIEGMGKYIRQFDWAWVEVNKQETYLGCMTIDDFDYFMLQRGFERIETGEWVADTWTDALYKKVL